MTIDDLRNIVRANGSPQLTAYAGSYMSVTFSKAEMAEIISDPPPRPVGAGVIQVEETVGILLKHTKDADGLLTLEAIKVTVNIFQRAGSPDVRELPDLELLSVKVGLPSVVGKSDKKRLSAKFKNLANFGFVYFKKETIVAMLAYKSAQTTGLRFKRAKVEMEQLPAHQVLSVEPDPINTATGIERRVAGRAIAAEGSNAPQQDFVTYVIGYACPPNWPDTYVNSPNIKIVDLPIGMG